MVKSRYAKTTAVLVAVAVYLRNFCARFAPSSDIVPFSILGDITVLCQVDVILEVLIKYDARKILSGRGIIGIRVIRKINHRFILTRTRNGHKSGQQ